jgi:4-carboxymuconolactone decarboxylase
MGPVTAVVGTPTQRTPTKGSCELLRRLAATDEGAAPPCAEPRSIPLVASTLDDKTRALVRLGALVATGAGPTSYKRHVAAALAAGATDEDVVDTLVAVSPTVGLAHLASATVGLALGLGYDIDAAFEGLGDPPIEDIDRAHGVSG